VNKVSCRRKFGRDGLLGKQTPIAGIRTCIVG